MPAPMLLIAASVAIGQAGPVVDVEHIDLATDFSWGYRCGVKQPLGILKDGYNVHQLSRSNYPEDTKGTPDHLLWVDENTGGHGISNNATQQIDVNVENPGGQVAMDDEGYIWFTNGGRGYDMPLDLYRSVSPYNPTAFELVVDDYATVAASTTPCVTIEDDKLFLYWRHHGSAVALKVKARMRRYDLDGDFQSYELETDIGSGVVDQDNTEIGIEQLWPRYDPRYGYQMYTWQYFHVPDHTFGSNPFVYSDDTGETWKRADGSTLANLPVNYLQIDPTLVPKDSIGAGEEMQWLVRDLGVGPDGTFWMTLPDGNPDEWGQWNVDFWRFADNQWTSQPLTGPMPHRVKPHACGATEDALVFLYSEIPDVNKIWARVSEDDGATWSDPQLVHEVPETAETGPIGVSWISFNQPADAYTDNAARFFYSYYRLDDLASGRNYQNSVGWLKVQLEEPCDADFNGDGTLDITDFVDFQLAFQNGDPAADCNDDGSFDVIDFVCFQLLFQAGCP